MVAASAKGIQVEIAKERTRLAVPAAPDAAAGLAGRYMSPELGQIIVRREGATVVFDFGAWKSEVASRKNDDGTTSFVTIDPTNDGFNFVVDTHDGKRGLIIHDGQHEYRYTEG